MIGNDEQASNNDANQADEKTDSAPKPKTRPVDGVTIIDVTHRGTGLGIVGIETLPIESGHLN